MFLIVRGDLASALIALMRPALALVATGWKARCCMAHGAVRFESNRAKPPDEGRFVPEGEPRRIKIAPHGQTMLARAVHLSPESGYFNSVPFSGSKELYPWSNFGNPGAIRQNTGISPRFARTALEIL